LKSSIFAQKNPAMKKLAIGEDDFKLLRQGNNYFVDKSLFIEEVIDDASRVLLFPRPRRFGKTLNMSMLHYFFTNKNTEENRGLFAGLAITKSPVFEQHQGQYPVVSLSFKSCKGDTYEKIYYSIRSVIAKAFKEYKFVLEKDKFYQTELEKFNTIIEEKANESLLSESILLLSDFLHRYYQKKVFILIDEYDTPIHEAYLNGFYTKAIDFLRTLLGNALKGNEYLQKGILTGILRVSKESMFSDLNNVEVYSVLNKLYNRYFGFTQHEVDEILKYYNLSNLQQDVKIWYNGYYFGNEEIYNPWSILSFVKNKGEFKPYWLSTSANALVHSLIKDSDKTVKKDIEDALNNTSVYSAIDENIAFNFLKNSREHILSFLVQTGYLKARYHDFVGSDRIYQIEIPNIELSKIYYTVIETWFNESIGSKDLENMLKALISGDIELFEDILNVFVVNYLSFYQTSKDHIEKVYHAFVLGMLITLKESYHIESERESGYGRVDILMTPKNETLPGIIIEMKKIRPRETTETAIGAALQQIEDRQYEAALRQQGCTNIMKVAVTFDGKRVWAKTQK
jgi:hypothetical protein